jgi:putative acetyltransferase
MYSQPLQSLQVVLQELGPDSAPETLAAGRELLLEYGHFVALYPSVSSFCFGTLENEATNLPQSYLDQHGGSIVAFAGSHPIGFVAWRSLPAPEVASAWELKRLWLRPQARGLGLGQTLVEEVIRRAKNAGKSALLLDTSPDVMAAACRLYRQLGFIECPPYSGPALPGIVYMRKTLN